MFSRWLLSIAGLCLGIVWAAAQAPERPRILTSIPPLYCWASNVAGDRADVENLLPPEVGPHDFSLRPSDLEKIRQADVVLLNGLGLESWLDRAIAANGKAGRRVVLAADGISQSNLIFELPQLKVGGGAPAHGHHHGSAANPHLWLDPVFAKHTVSNLATALAAVAPKQAEFFAANARAYCAKLDTLDAEFRAATAKLQHRDVVTFHDAFPYFCRRYDLKLVGVIEEVPGTSPSPKYLAALTQVIREKGVKVIFTEPQFNPRLAQQLAEDLGLAFAQLDVLETGALTRSAYEDGMRKNLRSLAEALR